jgi:hypothetical protein
MNIQWHHEVAYILVIDWRRVGLVVIALMLIASLTIILARWMRRDE